jgi:hypothetical protein
MIHITRIGIRCKTLTARFTCEFTLAGSTCAGLAEPEVGR